MSGSVLPRFIHCLTVTALLGGACNKEASKVDGAPAPVACTSEGLRGIVASLDKNWPGERAHTAVDGLLRSCGDDFDPWMKKTLDKQRVIASRGFQRAQAMEEMGATAIIPGPSYAKLMTSLCPNWVQIHDRGVNLAMPERAITMYEECKFERLGVISKEDLQREPTLFFGHDWWLHAWLENKGIDKQTILDFMTVMLELQRPSWEALWPVEGQELVPGTAGRPSSEDDVFVYVTPDAWLRHSPSGFESKARIEDLDGEEDSRSNKFAGYMHQPDEIGPEEPPPEEPDDSDEPRHKGEEGKMGKPTSKSKSGLYAMKGPKDAIPQMARNFDPAMAAREAERASSNEARADRVLVAVADKRAPYSWVRRALVEANLGQFKRFGALVQSGPHEGLVLEWTDLRVQQWTNGNFAVEITNDGFVVTWSEGETKRKVIQKSDDYDYAALASAAKQLGSGGRVGLTAPPGMPFEVVVKTAEAVRGQGCRPDNDEACVASEVRLFDPGTKADEMLNKGPFPGRGAHAVGLDDTDVWGGLPGRVIEEGQSRPIGRRDRGPVGRVRQAKMTVAGSLDKDIIRRIVRAHINEVRSCYKSGLEKDPKLKGRLVVDFVIDERGKTKDVNIKRHLGQESVGHCVEKAFERWKFPRPRSGVAKVTLPFRLDPG